MEAKGSRTQDRILESTIRLFAQSGHALTSFQAIADDCGLKQTAILYHFKDRNKLIAAAIERVVRNNHAIVSSHQPIQGDPLELLRNHFHQNFKWANRFREEAQLILLLYYQCTHDPAMRTLYRRIRKSATERIEIHLRVAKEAGMLSSEINTTDLAHLFHDALLGGIVNSVTTQMPKERFSQVRKRWDLLFSQYIRPNR